MSISSILKLAFDYDLEDLDLYTHFQSDLCSTICLVSYEKNSQIVQVEDSIRTIKLLLRGEIYAEINTLEGGSISGGKNTPISIFGLFELINGIPYHTACLLALEPCVFLEIEKSLFAKALDSEIDTLKYSIRYMCHFVKISLAQKDRSVMLTPKQKLLLFLYDSAKTKQLPVRISSTKESIALSINQNLRTVYRNINRLQQEGFLTLDKGKVVITETCFIKMKIEVKNYDCF